SGFIDQMQVAITRGESLTKAAHSVPQFTPLLMQMLTVGEETGHIAEMLDEVADFYENEVDYDLTRLADRIEPILIVALSGMVLILALAVFLPMWNMIHLVQGR